MYIEQCPPRFAGTTSHSGQPPILGIVSLKAANIVSGKYTYLQDLIKLRDHTEHDCLASWPTCPSPICLVNWTAFLMTHPDLEFASYIHSNSSSGFRIGFDRQGPPLTNFFGVRFGLSLCNKMLHAQVHMRKPSRQPTTPSQFTDSAAIEITTEATGQTRASKQNFTALVSVRVTNKK